jgi:hypothetical protein
MKRLIVLLGLVLCSGVFAAVSHAEDLVIADFEGHPNKVGGDVGVYGSLEPNWDDKASPYSWYYASNTPGYDRSNVHSGTQSFRLVNALGAKKDETWGSFSMDLGRTTDATVVPKKVDSKDVSGYKYLTFWVKGDKGGEKMELLFRDSHAASYMPQAKYKVDDITTEWKKVVVSMDDIKKLGIDLKSLDNIGIAFGPDAGNSPGTTGYIDDFCFTNNK